MHQPFEKRDPHLLDIGDVIYYNARQDGAPEPTKNRYFVVMALPTRLSDECYTFLPITHSQKDKSIFSKFNVPLSSISQKFQENLNKKSKRYGPSYFEIASEIQVHPDEFNGHQIDYVGNINYGIDSNLTDTIQTAVNHQQYKICDLNNEYHKDTKDMHFVQPSFKRYKEQKGDWLTDETFSKTYLYRASGAESDEIPLKYPYDLHPNPKAYPPKPASRPKEKEDNNSPDP